MSILAFELGMAAIVTCLVANTATPADALSAADEVEEGAEDEEGRTRGGVKEDEDEEDEEDKNGEDEGEVVAVDVVAGPSAPVAVRIQVALGGGVKQVMRELGGGGKAKALCIGRNPKSDALVGIPSGGAAAEAAEAFVGSGGDADDAAHAPELDMAPPTCPLWSVLQDGLGLVEVALMALQRLAGLLWRARGSRQFDCAAGGFWGASPENADLNQYWFSEASIQVLAEEVLEHGPRAALVSCPSIYFTLPAAARASCKVLEFDRAWQDDPGFVFYDFHHPEDVPPDLHHAFDLVVVDPPYITREVWSKYATTAKLLMKQGADDRGCPLGRLLCTSIAENAPMLRELLGIEPRRFRPAIPNLVYQYHTYTNYDSERLGRHNTEVDPDGEVPMPSADGGEAWEATYGAASGRPDELGIRPAGASLEAAIAAAGAEEAAPQPQDFGPAVAAVAELRECLGRLKRDVGGLDAALQAVVQRAERLAAARASAKADAAEVASRAAALDEALAARDAALGGLEEAAVAADRAEAAVSEVVAGGAAGAAGTPYVEVCASIREGALAIRPHTPRGSRRDVLAFSAGNRRHVQRIFQQQTALLAQVKELKRELAAPPGGGAQA
ncbi:unnamed protein product [Prorocentrum cordatum]|uniref:Uncharacterized protein n=1 Tax=Prorocentrum cordatum TaxID=2364126 RepID=A0ABN9SYT9_9DINO|nr:unnamed protein product [Polarella glacialis]